MRENWFDTRGGGVVVQIRAKQMCGCTSSSSKHMTQN
jgi:hypothetical protein